MRHFFRAIAAAAIILLPIGVSAHLAGGDDVTKDGLILDFGYDPSPPVAGAPSTFAFNLADAGTDTAVAPDSVWVRFVKDGSAAFAGTFLPKDGSVAFTAVLPDPGTYAITARYSYKGREIEGSFSVTASPPAATVAPAPFSTTAATPAGGPDAARVLAAVAVALGAYLYGEYRGRRARK